MRAVYAHPGLILAPNGRPAWAEALENNWYEASRYSTKRSLIWEPVQDARRDLDRYTRHELSKRARYLYKNSPLIRGLIERLVTITVGSGFHPVFKSSSEEWNTRARQWLRRKSRNIHLGPRCTMSQYHRAVARARFVDGECFSLETFDETSYTDMVQGLEADFIVGVKHAGKKDKFQVDGFNLNGQGVVVSYNIKGVDTPYAAEHVVHHFTPNRLGQYRGETVLAAAINTAHDVDDILSLEKECVKDASSKKDIIKTATGTLDIETLRSLRYQDDITNQTFNLPVDENAKNDYYRVRFGAEPIVLKHGDEYTPYKPDRPGSAWQGFMAFLANTICISAMMPPSVLLPIQVGGTDIRRDFDIAQKIIEPIQVDMVAEHDELLTYLMMGEVLDGELKAGCPDDWMVRSWMMPPRLNVDRNQAQQDREDVARGLMTPEEYHGRYQQDAEEVDDSIIKHAKRRKEKILAAQFTDVKEFVQIISLDSKMFQSKEEAAADDKDKTKPEEKPDAK